MLRLFFKHTDVEVYHQSVATACDLCGHMSSSLHMKITCYVWMEKETKCFSEVIKEKIQQLFLTANTTNTTKCTKSFSAVLKVSLNGQDFARITVSAVHICKLHLYFVKVLKRNLYFFRKAVIQTQLPKLLSSFR